MDFDIGGIYDAIFSSQQRAAGLADASSGHDRLVEEQLNDLTENSEYLKELVELRRIADAAQKQAELAEKQAKAAQAEAENAKKDSIEAKKDSRTANLIAFVSMLIALVSLVKQFIG